LTSVSGEWWRHLPHGGDPLALPEPAPDGRWQRGQAVAALYLASEEATAWAEWHRTLAEQGLPSSHGMPRDIWRYEVEVDDVADLSTPDLLAEHGLGIPRPRRRDWRAFQEVGERLWERGKRGILYPSAAHPGHLALCLFREGFELPGVTPLRPPETHRRLPPSPNDA
jgi:RES domain-containing protein